MGSAMLLTREHMHNIMRILLYTRTHMHINTNIMYTHCTHTHTHARTHTLTHTLTTDIIYALNHSYTAPTAYSVVAFSPIEMLFLN
jgi:hypothetical protein